MEEEDRSESSDHTLLPEESYRRIDAELVQAEREMHDVDAQLAAWHERQRRSKKNS